jgi:hypothetical protein
MSSVKRLQEEFRVVDIRLIESELFDGLNLARNSFAQLPAFECRAPRIRPEACPVCEMSAHPALSVSAAGGGNAGGTSV